jgi:hypothetical protein
VKRTSDVFNQTRCDPKLSPVESDRPWRDAQRRGVRAMFLRESDKPGVTIDSRSRILSCPCGAGAIVGPMHRESMLRIERTRRENPGDEMYARRRTVAAASARRGELAEHNPLKP